MQRLLNYNYIYLIPLFLSAIFSLKSFRLKWPGPFKLFSVFLISTLLVEVFAIAWKWELYDELGYAPYNLWIYNGYLVIKHLFLFYFFYGILTSHLIRRIILWSLVPFVLFCAVNYFYIQGPHYPNSYTIVVANTLTILLALAFFNQILAAKNTIRLKKSTEVWISFGTFIYYSGTLPLFIFFNYLLTRQQNVASSYFYINDALNIVMYLFYLISFLCKPHSLK